MAKANKVRYRLYQFSDAHVSLAAIFLMFIVYRFGLSSEIIKSNDLLITIATTLAGFLFAAQSIMVTLSPQNSFIKRASEQGYLKDFHRFCARAECIFVLLILPLFYLGKNEWADRVMMSAFFYGFIYTAWAVYIFSNITTRSANFN